MHSICSGFHYLLICWVYVKWLLVYQVSVCNSSHNLFLAVYFVTSFTLCNLLVMTAADERYGETSILLGCCTL
jgi:hypothetical protein